MPANVARKERRKRQRDEQPVSEHGESHHADSQKETRSAPNSAKKNKFGRKEMRNVTRTTSRNRDNYKDSNNNKKYRRNQPESESDDESEESEDNDEDIDSDDGGKQDNEKSMAYNALLTLLKHDHQSDDEEEEEEEEEDDEQSKDIDNVDDDRDEEEKLLEEVEGNATDDEEEEDVLVEEDLHEDENSINNKYDSFNLHFNDEDKIEKYCEFYEKKLNEIKKGNNKREKILKLNNRLKLDQSNYLVLDYKYDLKLKDNDLILDDKYSIKTATTLPLKLKYHNVKLRVQEKFNKIFDSNIEKELELELIESLLSYENINFQYYNQNLKFKENYQDYYLLHCINHLYKTRDRILNNNEKKTKYLKQIEEGLIEEKIDESLEDGLNFRDQGYTRPKILILLPTRNYAYKLVNKLINLCNFEKIENKSKFNNQFFDNFKIDDINNEKPDEFKEYFEGNSNDFFCLGLKFTRKTLKLYSSFNQSDIIIASPLGLKMILEKSKNSDNKKDSERFSKDKDSNNNNNNKKKEKSNASFLSSIEITVLDKSEFLLMQNWDHVKDIMINYLNVSPTTFSDLKVDFSRIRMWSINDKAKFLTQFINFSKYTTPEFNNITMNNNKISTNLLNGVKIFKPIVKEEDTIINQLSLKLVKSGLINKDIRLKQIFNRFNSDSIIDEPDKRFNFFKNSVLPQLIKKSSYNNGIMIYIPSYIDYLRIKNYLKDDTHYTFVSIDEYSTQKELNRNRTLFVRNSNNAKILLYTERLHFYKRFDIKGVKNLIFYGLPKDPIFYSEVINFIVNNKIRIDLKNLKIQQDLMLNGGNDGGNDEDGNQEEEEDPIDLNLCMIRILISKFDMINLEKIVGLRIANQLCFGENEMTEFK